MARRVHVPQLNPGELTLSENEAHHLRDVLRMQTGEMVELFDSTGRVAQATITHITPTEVKVTITTINTPPSTFELTIASAIPKGDRADWLIEKLSELGVTRFIPLKTERSVVHPEGKNKLDRWTRIATESAKQSHRPGLMQISSLTPLIDILTLPNSIYLSPQASAPSLSSILHPLSSIALLIGPEGGWSEEELHLFNQHNIPPARLTSTILRIETAAIAAAAIVLSNMAG